jgi:photosystem II stability/assembly factor-like uncharacterized protein
MKNFICVLSYVVLNSIAIHPQWQLLGLEGEDIKKILLHPNSANTIYAGSSHIGGNGVGGLFISTNSGNTWDTLLTSISPTDFVVNYQNPNIIYIVGGVAYGLIKTTDGGINWFSSSNGIDINAGTGTYTIAMDPINPNILFCGTLGPMGGSLYKTTNSGEDWFIPNADSFLFDIGAAVIEYDPYNPSMLYVGRAMNGKLFRSTDGGVNFEFAGYENGGGIYSLKFGRNSDEMYATSSWSFSYPVGIFRTNNGGVTWENLGEGFNGSVSVLDVALNFLEQEYIYIAVNSSMDTSGVYVKIDDGPWTLIGLNDEFISSLLIKNSLLYAGTNNGIYTRELISNMDSETNLIKNGNFVLYQNYPNPFNPTTTIKFEIPDVETTRPIVFTTLEVYDILGNEVATLVNEEKQLGVYEVEFDGSQLSSGIYFYTLSAGNFTATKKLILIK